MGDSGSLKDQLLRKEAQRAKLISYLSYGIGGALTVLLCLLIFGGRLGILDYLGLEWVISKQKGVYADCSKKENQNVAYCRPKTSESQRQWDDIRRAGGGQSGRRKVIFSLNGD
ncbi:MAG: hypothetical protein KDD42_06300 [Bdellovibrionales bacterium]|nr:hypothetical protein [Bdellovibrionales bacterium]